MPKQILHKNPVEIVSAQGLPESLLKTRTLAPISLDKRKNFIELGDKVDMDIRLILSYRVWGDAFDELLCKRPNAINLEINPESWAFYQKQFQELIKTEIKAGRNSKELMKKFRSQYMPSPLTLFTILHRIFDATELYNKASSMLTTQMDEIEKDIRAKNRIINTWTGRNNLMGNETQWFADLFARYMLGYRHGYVINQSQAETEKDSRALANLDEKINKLMLECKEYIINEYGVRPDTDIRTIRI